MKSWKPVHQFLDGDSNRKRHFNGNACPNPLGAKTMTRLPLKVACLIATALYPAAAMAQSAGFVMMPYQPQSAPTNAPAPMSAPTPMPETTSHPVRRTEPAASIPMSSSMAPVAAASAPVSSSPSPLGVQGFGKDIPVSFAVRQIAPEGYLVNFSPEVDQDAVVSWSGGPDWHAVLRNTLATKGMTVSYEGQLVRVSGGSLKAAAVVSPVEPKASSREPIRHAPVERAAQADRPAPAPVDPVPSPAPRMPTRPAHDDVPTASDRTGPAPMPSRAAAAQRNAPWADQQASRAGGGWRGAQGETLADVLGDWAERAGWHFVYDSKMIYELQAPVSFSGDFVQAAGDLVSSVQARPKPYVTFYKANQTIRVSNTLDQLN